MCIYIYIFIHTLLYIYIDTCLNKGSLRRNSIPYLNVPWAQDHMPLWPPVYRGPWAWKKETGRAPVGAGISWPLPGSRWRKPRRPILCPIGIFFHQKWGRKDMEDDGRIRVMVIKSHGRWWSIPNVFFFQVPLWWFIKMGSYKHWESRFRARKIIEINGAYFRKPRLMTLEGFPI